MKIVLDSTDGLSIGILNNDNKWNSFDSLTDVKASRVLHSIILERLNESSVDIRDINGIVYCSGPGSYTGMRLAKGFADILELEGIKKNSFYHYHVPKLVGVEDYFWITNAFKGEYFVYNSSSDSNELILEADVEKYLEKERIYTNSQKLIDEHKLQSTKSMLEEHPEIFNKVNSEEKLYYFRPENVEFKVSKK